MCVEDLFSLNLVTFTSINCCFTKHVAIFFNSDGYCMIYKHLETHVHMSRIDFFPLNFELLLDDMFKFLLVYKMVDLLYCNVCMLYEPCTATIINSLSMQLWH